jgi:hypothetical protein
MWEEPHQRNTGRRGRKVKARVRKALNSGSSPLAASSNRTNPVEVIPLPSIVSHSCNLSDAPGRILTAGTCGNQKGGGQ